MIMRLYFLRDVFPVKSVMMQGMYILDDTLNHDAIFQANAETGIHPAFADGGDLRQSTRPAALSKSTNAFSTPRFW